MSAQRELGLRKTARENAGIPPERYGFRQAPIVNRQVQNEEENQRQVRESTPMPKPRLDLNKNSMEVNQLQQQLNELVSPIHNQFEYQVQETLDKLPSETLRKKASDEYSQSSKHSARSKGSSRSSKKESKLAILEAQRGLAEVSRIKRLAAIQEREEQLEKQDRILELHKLKREQEIATVEEEANYALSRAKILDEYGDESDGEEEPNQDGSDFGEYESSNNEKDSEVAENDTHRNTPVFRSEPVKEVQNEEPSKLSHAEQYQQGQNQFLEITKMLVKNMDTMTQLVSDNHTNSRNSQPGGRELNKILVRQSIKTDLPFFGGEPEKWNNFISSFNRTTELGGYSNEENILRLEKCLKGAARSTVESLLCHPDNVSTIIRRLQRSFGRPEIIIKHLVEEAKKLPVLKDNNLELFFHFSTTIQNMVDTMKSLKMWEYLRNPMLVEELVLKLPPSYQLEWAKKISTLESTANVGDFATFIEELASTLELLPSVKTSLSYKTEIKSRNRKQVFFNVNNEEISDSNHIDGTKDIKINNVNKSSEKGKGKIPTNTKNTSESCELCKIGGHSIGKCRKFLALKISERWDKVKELKLCFCCLKSNHALKFCGKKKECGENKCVKIHHKLLHQEYEKVVLNVNEDSNNKKLKPSVLTSALLNILPVTLFSPKGKVDTYALLDSGSMTSLINSELADKLGLDGINKSLIVRWFDGSIRVDEQSKIVKCDIKGSNEKEVFSLSQIRTVSNWSLPPQSLNSRKLISKWKHLKDVGVKNCQNVIPQILIGQDHAHLIIARKIIEGPPNSPVLTWTKLGWSLHGSLSSFKGRIDNNFSVMHISEGEDELHRLVKESFTTENFGVKVNNHQPRSKEDERALEILTTSTKRIEGKFESGLLWKKENVIMPESYNTAFNRLKHIEKKMDKDPQYAELYCSKIEDYISKGYARLLTEKEANISSNKTWYLPHFGVVNPNKPGKFRLVFDAAAKSKGVSLNSFLMTGPDLLNPLPSVLLRFRRGKIAVTGDIKEMFHQIKIREKDVDAQRFLWRGMSRENNPDVLIMDSMIFGSTSSPSTALYVVNKNAEECKSDYPDAVNSILTNEYMDDLLESYDDENEALTRIQEIIQIHQKGGFEICSWLSNSKCILDSLPEELKSKSVKELSSDFELPIERVLGMWWNAELDVFTFKLNFHKVKPAVANGTQVPTKRDALKLVMSIFDPLGFATCTTIKGRIILQEIWRSNVDWDEEVSQNIFQKWTEWLNELKRLQYMKVPRCYILNVKESQNNQIHMFVDASEQAFSAVAYIRSQIGMEVKTSIVLSKSKVAPLKPISIPRLELQAALMGSRLLKTIVNELGIPINSTYLWSDSKIVLYWIKSDARRFKQFVSHRLGEILELTDVKDWRWIPTKLNVSDLATRFEKPMDSASEYLWINGPEFLCQQESEWPEQPEFVSTVNDDPEIKGEFLGVSVISNSIPLPSFHRFSSWLKLVRTTAWIKRYIQVLHERVNDENKNKLEVKSRKSLFTKLNPEFELKLDELEQAESLLIRQSQLNSFGEELELLTKNQEVPKQSRLYKLSPIINKEGLIVIKGRTEFSPEIDMMTKQPIILDNNCFISRLLINHYHKKLNHQGLETIINEIRRKYWILNIRAEVKRCSLNCQWCKIKRCQPNPPEMGNLPLCRVTRPDHPFYYTGVDYFGPMEVTVGRHHEKRWGVIFTCLSTRAVHIELAYSLDTDSCIMAIQRFASRRPLVREMYSDNGTNFKGADRELKESLEKFNSNKIQQELKSIQNGINWNFIPPGAPHMGGCWERLIKSIKSSLSVVLKSQYPKDEEMITLFAQIEFILNSRPLTHISVDPDDPQPLTPNHFLIEPYKGYVAAGEFDESDLLSRKRWSKIQVLSDHFWKRWIHEYLPTLTHRTKWFKPQPPAKVGDVVLIVDENNSRNSWPMGRVIAIYPGKDGQVRAVDVETNSGTYRRPVTKICILDVCKEDEQKCTPVIEGENVTS